MSTASLSPKSSALSPAVLAVQPVILCGGSGTRLWPLSRAGFPKQFLCLTGDDSLFQLAAKRLAGLAAADIALAAPLIACNEEHRFLALEQLRETGIEPGALLLEPVGRNTAPALTLAALAAVESGNDPVLVVTPADQTVTDEEAFTRAMQQAVREAASGAIVILGITPDRPETGYGYIKTCSPFQEPPCSGEDATLPSPPGRRAGDEGRDATLMGAIRDARTVASLPPDVDIYTSQRNSLSRPGAGEGGGEGRGSTQPLTPTRCSASSVPLSPQAGRGGRGVEPCSPSVQEHTCSGAEGWGGGGDLAASGPHPSLPPHAGEGVTSAQSNPLTLSPQHLALSPQSSVLSPEVKSSVLSPQSCAFIVESFVEKPDAATAQRYLDEGGYYWNAGMFVLKASVWIAALERFRPDIAQATRTAWKKRTTDIQTSGRKTQDSGLRTKDSGLSPKPSSLSPDLKPSVLSPDLSVLNPKSSVLTSKSCFIRPGKAEFTAIPAESIDYAVMEKIANATTQSSALSPKSRSLSPQPSSLSPKSSALSPALNPSVLNPKSSVLLLMVPLSAGWSDLGAWDAVWQVLPKDESGNAHVGDVLTTNSRNTLVHATSRLVSLVGVKDLVVIETPDAVLVADRAQSQDVKKIVEALSNSVLSPQHSALPLTHRKVHRPWGWYDSIDEGGRFKVKRILVKPKASLSLQMHHHRAEHWIVVKGTAEVTCGEKVIMLTENQSTYIPLGAAHRLANPGSIPLEIIEVQSGSYLGEDDIVRFEDNYGRGN